MLFFKIVGPEILWRLKNTCILFNVIKSIKREASFRTTPPALNDGRIIESLVEIKELNAQY